MKKTINRLTKRIMALSLSIIMMFGIIPCNIASADGPKKIDEIYITKTGFLTVSNQTIVYTVPSDANYILSDDPKTGWYKDEACTVPQDFTDTGNTYKKITITPKEGYEFDPYYYLYINDFPKIMRGGPINENGTITYLVSDVVQKETISLDFNKPTTCSEFIKLKNDRTKFTMVGKDLDTVDGFVGKDVSEVSGDNKDKGFYYLIFTYSFDSEAELNKIGNFQYRNEYPVIQDGISDDTLSNMNVGDVYVYKVKGDKYQIIVYEKYDFRVNAIITHDPIVSFMQFVDTDEISYTLINPSDNLENKVSYSLQPLYYVSKDAKDVGKFLFITNIDFNTEEEQQVVNTILLNGTNIKTKENEMNFETDNIDEIMKFINTHKVGWYNQTKKAIKIVIAEKYDLGLTPTVNINTSVGTTAKTAFETITAQLNGQNISNVSIDEIMEIKDDGSSSSLDKDSEADMFEKDKTYVVKFKFNELSSAAYKSINVNGQTLTFTLETNEDVTKLYNKYLIDDKNKAVFCYYKFVGGQVLNTGSSKKYKANDKEDTAEKIVGTGKKGSTRTIIPEQNRKVESIIVTDKNGNEIEVTKNEDGTFSFIQPASDVNVKVRYKNRVITLNIGSTKADVDGEESNLDVCPILRNDRTMLPIRYIAENLGATVLWDETNPNYVVITRGDTKIEITLGSNIMLVNGEEVLLDQVAFAENNRTYLPVRAVSEALNAIVEWNAENPSVVKIYER